MFDLGASLHETAAEDISATNPTKLAEMKQKVNDWLKTLPPPCLSGKDDSCSVAYPPVQ